MLRHFVGCIVLAMAGAASQAQDAASGTRPVPYSVVTIDDTFWTPRQKANREATFDQNLMQCEQTGRLANIEKAGSGQKGGFQGYFFNDSDVFKMVEGGAYLLGSGEKDRALEATMNRLIALIAKAQQPDGYLDSYFTVAEPDKRWSNLKDMHELYCAGHLIEAGVAHHQATGGAALLDVAKKLADHIDATFGPGKRPGVCGHPEIELALIRLWRDTGEKRYLDLARYFVHERGRADGRSLYGEYAQDHMPLSEQDRVVGDRKSTR